MFSPNISTQFILATNTILLAINILVWNTFHSLIHKVDPKTICQPYTLFNGSNVQQTYSFLSCETNQVIGNIPIQPNQISNVCSYSSPFVSNPLVTITVLVGTCP